MRLGRDRLTIEISKFQNNKVKQGEEEKTPFLSARMQIRHSELRLLFERFKLLINRQNGSCLSGLSPLAVRAYKYTFKIKNGLQN